VIARPRLLRNWRLRGRDFLTTPIFRVLIKAFIGATALKKIWREGACASRSLANAQQKNCVRLNNQGAASDAPLVRRQTATKLPQAMLRDSLSLAAVEAALGLVCSGANLFNFRQPSHESGSQ